MKLLKLSLVSLIAIGIFTIGNPSIGFDVQQASSAVISYAHGNTGWEYYSQKGEIAELQM